MQLYNSNFGIQSKEAYRHNPNGMVNYRNEVLDKLQ